MNSKINISDIEFTKETKVTIRGSRRRITLPKYIVDRLEIKDKDRVRWLLFKDGTVCIMKVI